MNVHGLDASTDTARRARFVYVQLTRSVVMWFLKVIGVLVVAAPVSVVGTFMLGPLWNWFETNRGIESVGHAMYAGWCFTATYIAIVVPCLWLLAWSAATRKDQP